MSFHETIVSCFSKATDYRNFTGAFPEILNYQKFFYSVNNGILKFLDTEVIPPTFETSIRTFKTYFEKVKDHIVKIVLCPNGLFILGKNISVFLAGDVSIGRSVYTDITAGYLVKILKTFKDGIVRIQLSFNGELYIWMISESGDHVSQEKRIAREMLISDKMLEMRINQVIEHQR